MPEVCLCLRINVLTCYLKRLRVGHDSQGSPRAGLIIHALVAVSLQPNRKIHSVDSCVLKYLIAIPIAPTPCARHACKGDIHACTWHGRAQDNASAHFVLPVFCHVRNQPCLNRFGTCSSCWLAHPKAAGSPGTGGALPPTCAGAPTPEPSTPRPTPDFLLGSAPCPRWSSLICPGAAPNATAPLAAACLSPRPSPPAWPSALSRSSGPLALGFICCIAPGV